MQQEAYLGLGAPEQWERCRHNFDFPVALLFEDGECHLLKRPQSYPRQWNWVRQPNMWDLIPSQVLDPQRMEIELRAGMEQQHIPFFTRGQPLKYDGTAFPIVSAPPVQGHHETQYGYRLGWEYGGEANNRVDERRFIKDLRIIRKKAYLPRYVGSGSQTPPPVRTNYSQGCLNPITASWRENRAPVVHGGVPPEVNDIASGYGPQP